MVLECLARTKVLPAYSNSTGEEIIYEGGHVARFTVKRIAMTPETPHGISYSLTFHAPHADG